MVLYWRCGGGGGGSIGGGASVVQEEPGERELRPGRRHTLCSSHADSMAAPRAPTHKHAEHTRASHHTQAFKALTSFATVLWAPPPLLSLTSTKA